MNDTEICDILQKLPKSKISDFDDRTIAVIKESADYWLPRIKSSDCSNFMLLIIEYYLENDKHQDALDFLNNTYSRYEKHCEYEYAAKNTIFELWARCMLRNGDREGAKEKIKKSMYYLFCDNISWRGYEFFSFRTFTNEFSLVEIQKHLLTLAHPRRFNDPLDTLFFPWLQDKLNTAKTDEDKEIAILLQKAANYIKVRCFARSRELPDAKHSDEKYYIKTQNISEISSLMWAHYSDSHKGFCIKYRFDEKIMNNDTGRYVVFRMGNAQYKKNFQIRNGISLQDALYTKAFEWHYEKEARLISLNPQDDLADDFEDIPISADCIQAIYLGVRCSEDNKNKMLRILNNTSIPLYQMQFSKKNIFRLEAVRIG